MSTSLSIGITGGIGSGKSIVCKLFAHLGAPVYDADSQAQRLMAHDAELKARLIAAFGASSFDADGRIKKDLRGMFFSDPDKLHRLNALVHPAVAQDYESWREAHASEAYTVKEAALLIEAGSYRQLDRIILVCSPIALRLRRVLARDLQRSVAQVRHIMGRQMNDEEKMRYADYLIVNDNIQPILPRVLELHAQFISQRTAPAEAFY